MQIGQSHCFETLLCLLYRMDNGQPSDEWAEEHNEQSFQDDWTDSLGVSIENPIYENTFDVYFLFAAH